MNKATLNRWLCSTGTKTSLNLDIGEKSLGTNWRHEIPVTSLLLVGLHSGKVEIFGEYDPMLLVGGFKLCFRKKGEIATEDFIDLPVTRKQFEEKYLK